MKNAVTYAFCEKHPDPEAHLDRSVYVNARNTLVPKSFSGNKKKIHQGNLAKLIEALNDKRHKSSKSFIKHYSIEYDFVPLWVLQKKLDLWKHLSFLPASNEKHTKCNLQKDTGSNQQRPPGKLPDTAKIAPCLFRFGRLSQSMRPRRAVVLLKGRTFPRHSLQQTRRQPEGHSPSKRA